MKHQINQTCRVDSPKPKANPCQVPAKYTTLQYYNWYGATKQTRKCQSRWKCLSEFMNHNVLHDHERCDKICPLASTNVRTVRGFVTYHMLFSYISPRRRVCLTILHQAGWARRDDSMRRYRRRCPCTNVSLIYMRMARGAHLQHTHTRLSHGNSTYTLYYLWLWIF